MVSQDQDARKSSDLEPEELRDAVSEKDGAIVVDDDDLELDIDVDFDIDDDVDFSLDEGDEAIIDLSDEGAEDIIELVDDDAQAMIEMISTGGDSSIELVDDDVLAMDALEEELLAVDYDSVVSSFSGFQAPPSPPSTSGTGEHQVIGRVALGSSSSAQSTAPLGSVAGEGLKDVHRLTQEQEGVILVLEAQLEQSSKTIEDLEGRLVSSIDESVLLAKERRIASLEIELKDAVAVAIEARASLKAGQDADALRFRVETLEPALEMARSKNETLRSENTRMKRGVDRATGEVSEAEGAKDLAQKGHEAALGQLAIKENELIQSIQDLGEARAKIVELNKMLDATRVDAENAQDVRDKSQERFLHLQQAFDAEHEELESLREALGQARETIATATADRDKALTDHADAKSSLEQKVLSLEEEVDFMKLTEAEAAVTQQQADAKIDALNVEVAQLGERSSQAGAEAASLGEKLEEVAAEMSKAAEVRDDLQAQLEAASQALEIHRLEAEKERESLEAEGSALNTSLADAQAQAEAMAAEKSSLEEELAALGAANSALSQGLERVLDENGVESCAEGGRDLLAELGGLLDEASEERGALSERLLASTAEAERLQGELDARPTAEEFTALRQESDAFRATIEESAAKDEAGQLRAEHQELAEAYEALQESHFDRSKELMSALTDAERMRANLVKIAEELAAVREEADNLARHSQELETQREDLAKRAQELEARVGDDSGQEEERREAELAGAELGERPAASSSDEFESEENSGESPEAHEEVAEGEDGFMELGGADDFDDDEAFSDLEIEAEELAFGEDEVDALGFEDDAAAPQDDDFFGLEDDFSAEADDAPPGRGTLATVVDDRPPEMEDRTVLEPGQINLDDLDFGEDDFEDEDSDFFDEVFDLDEKSEGAADGSDEFVAEGDIDDASPSLNAASEEEDFFDDEIYEDLESLDDESVNPPSEEVSDPFAQLESQGMLNLRPSADFEMAKGIDSKAGYLLSQADGETSIQEIIELSPLDMAASARIVVELIELGAMRV